MIYKIYELVNKEVTTDFVTLKHLCYWTSDLKYNYNSELEAKNDIIENKNQLKGKDLVILPVLNINYKGEIENKMKNIEELETEFKEIKKKIQAKSLEKLDLELFNDMSELYGLFLEYGVKQFVSGLEWEKTKKNN